ncbi:unnamed protein product [Caretta caretta]
MLDSRSTSEASLQNVEELFGDGLEDSPWLTIHEVEDLRCWDWHQDSRLLGYRNTARVGEVRTLCQGKKPLREWG